ncbi:MAG TPA: hypothetical protein VN715_04840 [Roseiarcus sp.]|nr:hypothetical protein [Roseiarcus sp.]
MKSILGLVAALCVAAAFAIAYEISVRPGANWLDGQWLFLAALPYNWTMLRLVGESNFSPDAPLQLAAASLFDVTLAYLVGALVEALLRLVWRLLRRPNFQA